ncbi:SipW-dependent-type signal peptide-containing protein [Halorubrum sp. CBA1229]|uniref:SipW-dependent-type signal peptide-containing protein n=1 Tax=Halorubrum sp. CBA1229 TaxID=1853699 RepID=UPI0020D176A6|nr:SipW-dependent-type signal peptide-containing protein [Halorubrum sp. CBA1229]
MSNKSFKLSRRKALASLGAVGVASAGAGLGTSAYFSDTESFENNTITAGELDLKVDWTEHYSDWSDDESDEVDVSMEPDGDYDIGFPAAAPEAEQSVFVKHMEDARGFLANTAIEAFPDTLTDDPASEDYDGEKVRFDNDSDICDIPADLDGGDGVLSHPYRTGANVDGGVTIGDGPNPQTTKAGDPLVNISDAKPGDFGEVTFSFHLCDNPGYVWLTGELVSASENGLTEPEMEEDDEDQTLNDDGEIVAKDDEETVEILDEIRTAFWYDTGTDGVYGEDYEDKDGDRSEGDNYLQTEEKYIPLGGTLRSVLTALENGMFPLDAEPVSPADEETGGESGETPTISAYDDASVSVYNSTQDDPFASYTNKKPRNLQCADYEKLLGIDLVGTDIEAGMLEENTDYNSCADLTVNTLTDTDDNGTPNEITISTGNPVRVVSVKGGNEGENIYVWDEPVILDEVTLTTPTDQDISNIDVCCPVNGSGGDNGDNGETDDRQCFPNSTTAYVGFEWWLPADVGNEVQGDSVTFDLGFYTEQCRHNDGSGQT